jgi:NADH:ubiquinone oxidoreductase subunit H
VDGPDLGSSSRQVFLFLLVTVVRVSFVRFRVDQILALS